MTKKHFEGVAAVIKESVDKCPNVHGHTYHHEIADGLADYFEEVNPRFDRDRFMVATGTVGVT